MALLTDWEREKGVRGEGGVGLRMENQRVEQVFLGRFTGCDRRI